MSLGESCSSPGVQRLHWALVDDVSRIEIHNAQFLEIPFELHLRLVDGAQLIGADQAARLGVQHGRTRK
jgi:hypothetical protein